MSNGKMSFGARSYLAIGFFFLYAPIVSLIVFSFNQSRLVTVWGGFSTHWYGELFNDDALKSAVALSFKIAFLSAIAAVLIGTIAGLVLARFGRFKGSSLFAGLITAPMVMPEVIVGLSMLLLFVALSSTMNCGIDVAEMTGIQSLACSAFGERGMTTIWIGHTTLCIAYVAILIQSRLREMDKSLEEAAMDLGCHPFKVFFVITIPVIAPALVSGFLLSFTLSLDDYVLTAFLSGPGSTTLPQWIFSSIKLGLTPKVNALATIVVAIVTIFVVLSNRMMLKAQKSREAAMQAAAAGGH
ncbi:ABC transporter permease subunit [Leeia sp. TBRC 13508]|uniref:ABC transporter permease subunit n=1 Tax=Leeia speluncae TaxID=2884804 RepID=A0ABS8D1R1_9NEIS|nr:ABC transporter permease subunit [Leeia speluncae]MCB6182137.1 ABC transporter permease subunit [Leeia speluncae]